MKKIILLIPVLFISAIGFSQSNGFYVEKSSFATAIEYNDYVVDMVDMIDGAWTKAIEEEDLKLALDASKNLNKITGAVLKSLKKLQGWDGETAFKQAAFSYTTHMNNISKKELPQFIKLIRAKGGMTVAGEKKAETLIPTLDNKREELFEAIVSSQKNFATRYDFTIEN